MIITSHNPYHSPFELLRPRPSLSTTSSAHCTDRPLEVCAPRSRRIWGACSLVSGVCDGVSVCVCEGAGVLRCCCRCDMISIASGSRAGIFSGVCWKREFRERRKEKFCRSDGCGYHTFVDRNVWQIVGMNCNRVLVIIDGGARRKIRG